MTEQEHNTNSTTVRLIDYGAMPDSELDTQPAMARAIRAAFEIPGPVVLDCARGRYHFYPEKAIRAPYYISNTTSEEENQDVTKTIAILLKGMNDVTLEGNGSLFIFHGKQTLFLLDKCTNVEIRNLRTDYHQPTVTEMTIISTGKRHFDARIHPDSRYQIRDNKLTWLGEDWSFAKGPMQTYDPLRNTTWRIDNWLELAQSVEELKPMTIRLHFDFQPDVVVGHVLQNRDGIRDQVGVFMTECSDISWRDVSLHFLHGLGVVGQFSTNLTFSRMNLAPRTETGRMVAGFADFLHISSCRGKVAVMDSHFSGSHDDPVNVHGTYLRIVDQLAVDCVKVRFMHPQTYGLPAFYPGDEIEFVRSGSLTTYASNHVVAVKRLSARELLLTLAHPVPEGMGRHDVIENVTWTPEVEITNNHFARVPTRGILVTTRRKVLITGNTFERMSMNAILIAVDAESWYESGRVEEVMITDNHFIECGSREHTVIFISPENVEVDESAPVHRQVVILNNRFETSGDVQIVSAKSTHGLVFKSNQIISTSETGKLSSLEETIYVSACTEVDLADNTFTNVQEGTD
ncbi:right-handed parallel beta-helix repeat-containing protein [Paenibacillus pabuli]|uniref:right-handed parallel beta-helix repeat-containing protein n=1 Tax=Paenibacillus pabuli TaxID=1472 RepID=UPI000A7B4F38|nr:right-handed parallel beta-helix repeat-containing protein [Paenibacillus pabuli]MEC0128027.1 right-handed parallel beta-helix repeat-containing protein [Paenibacillus pabuli]